MRGYLIALFFFALALVSAYCFGQALSVAWPAALVFFLCWLAGLLALVAIRRADLQQWGEVIR